MRTREPQGEGQRLALLLALALATPAIANEAFFKAEAFDAQQVAAVPALGDKQWSAAPAKSFTVSAQRSVRLNDKRANEALDKPGVGKITVRALVSETELGVQIEWADETKDLLRQDETNAYADSVAIELPVKFGAAIRLPYIGMGDPDEPVMLYMQRATKEGSTPNEYVAAGFGSLTRLPKTVSKMSMAYDAQQKAWRALFVRPLNADGHSVAAGVVPIAFAVWDGARNERGGYKQLSAWHYVKLPKPAVDLAYVKQLSWGYNPGDLGDPEKGKAIAETVCIACHHFPGKTIAPVGMAPNLSDIGAIATPSYLRESIQSSGAVIVHALQPNAHYSKTGPVDSNGAYPNADAYQWSTTMPDGKVISKMPPFNVYTPEQVADLVAYLKSLDGTKK